MTAASLNIDQTHNIALNADAITQLRNWNLTQGNLYDVSLNFLSSGSAYVPDIANFSFLLRKKNSSVNLYSQTSPTSGVSGWSFSLDAGNPLFSAALGGSPSLKLDAFLTYVDGASLQVIEPFGAEIFNSFSGLASVSSYVSTLNSLSGDVTLTGGGSVTVSKSGQNIIFSSPAVDLTPYYLASNPSGFINHLPSNITGTFYGDGSNLTGIAGGGSPTWGTIGGTLADQTDLATALSGKAPIAQGVNPNQTSFSLTDAGNVVTVSSSAGGGSPNTINIPANSSVAFPVGTYIDLICVVGGGAGAPASITNDGGVAINWINGVSQGKIQLNQVIRFIKTDTDTWFATAPYNPGLLDGVLKGDGAGNLATATAGTDFQSPITANGIIKSDGAGNTSTASAGTDYSPGLQGAIGIVKCYDGTNLSIATAGTDYVSPGSIPTPTLSNVLGASAITPVSDGTYAISNSMGGNVQIQGGIIIAWSPAS